MNGIAWLLGQLAQDFYYGEWSEDKQKISEVIGYVPVASNVQDIYLDERQRKMNGKTDQQRYLDDHGMEWSDVVDPRKLASLGSTTQSMASLAKATIGFVSNNIERLYK